MSRSNLEFLPRQEQYPHRRWRLWKQTRQSSRWELRNSRSAYKVCVDFSLLISLGVIINCFLRKNHASNIQLTDLLAAFQVVPQHAISSGWKSMIVKDTSLQATPYKPIFANSEKLSAAKHFYQERIKGMASSCPHWWNRVACTRFGPNPVVFGPIFLVVCCLRS